MYTRCPHCTTIFQVTAGQLRLAHGDVSCVTCEHSFNALDSLADDVPTLIMTSANPDTEGDKIPDGADTIVNPDSKEEEETATEEALIFSEHAIDIEPDAGEDLTDEAETPDFSDLGDSHEPTEVSLEFNAPEQTWGQFFLTDAELAPHAPRDHDDRGSAADTNDERDNGSALEHQTDDQNEWQMFLRELDNELPAEEIVISGNDEAVFADPFVGGDEEEEEETDALPEDEAPPALPPWLTDREPEEERRPAQTAMPGWRGLSLFTVLALLLAGQLVHYNRDALAAHPAYGGMVRSIYARLGVTLYPDWRLDAFEVTGTEAVAGRLNRNGLDIHANVTVTGKQPVGLPLIRVVLRDRWASPVASRVFVPHEYLRDYEPARTVVTPGAALPVEVSVADPGAAATGYIVDICLPRRKDGLECQIAREPFR